MIRVPFTECVKLVGEAPKRYSGEKTYVSTGAVNCNEIDRSQLESYSFDNKPSRANLVASEGDILFAKMQKTHKVLLINEKIKNYIFSTGFCAVRANKRYLTNECLFYLLNSPQFLKQKDKNCSGATQKAITIEALSKLIVNIPEIYEQAALVEKFEKINALINKRKQQLEKFDLLVKSKFVEMFGDYKSNSKGWATKRGEELFVFSSGKFLNEKNRKNKGVPVYGGNGIAWYTDVPLINEQTIVIGRVGVYCGNIRLVREPVWITDNAIYIKNFKQNNFNLQYLYYLMLYMNFKQYADFSGQPKITQKPLEKNIFLIPPIELQNEFARVVEQTDKAKLKIKKSLEKLETLKKSLMQKYFG